MKFFAKINNPINNKGKINFKALFNLLDASVFKVAWLSLIILSIDTISNRKNPCSFISLSLVKITSFNWVFSVKNTIFSAEDAEEPEDKLFK